MMDVKRFDTVTVANTAATLCTVPSGKAYTVTGFTIVETAGNTGEITIKIGSTQIIGQFGIDGPDTIYPITNVNMAATETLNVTCTIGGVYVTASVVERTV